VYYLCLLSIYTLAWETLRYSRETIAQRELIDPDKLEAFFQPYIDYGNALDEKAREGNKL